MSKMDELFNDMYKYCEENGCWTAYMTAKEWCDCIGTTYSPASFTSLVNAGRLERDKAFREKSYQYNMAPVGVIKEKIEEEKKKRQRKNAEYTIAHYDEEVARVRARYEELIKEAEEYQERYLKYQAECLERAKKMLEDTNN